MHPLSEDPRESVSLLGESRLIHQISKWLGDVCPKSPHGIGDDCAVLPVQGNADWLVTTDPVVFGRHFDESLPPRKVGAKLLLRNLSDIAAMGGTPAAAVVSLALPPQTSVTWLKGFYIGLASVARRFKVRIIGGDITRCDGALAAHLTLMGRTTAGRALTRTGARNHDVILVTGPLGGSILGKHASFRPRLEEGAWLAARPEVHACMDISDGLAKDLPALIPAGHVAYVDSEMVPVSRAARKLAARTGSPALHHALTDGEDYELLLCVSGDPKDLGRLSEAYRKRFNTQLHLIGAVHLPKHKKADHPVESIGGDLDWSKLGGYEHFRETSQGR
jgi:thiamine-monophosphate kinase